MSSNTKPRGSGGSRGLECYNKWFKQIIEGQLLVQKIKFSYNQSEILSIIFEVKKQGGQGASSIFINLNRNSSFKNLKSKTYCMIDAKVFQINLGQTQRLVVGVQLFIEIRDKIEQIGCKVGEEEFSVQMDHQYFSRT